MEGKKKPIFTMGNEARLKLVSKAMLKNDELCENLKIKKKPILSWENEENDKIIVTFEGWWSGE